MHSTNTCICMYVNMYENHAGGACVWYACERAQAHLAKK